MDCRRGERVTWSEKTLELRDRYHALYGASQALWAGGAVTALAHAAGVPLLAWVVLSAAAIVGSALWRRSWRRYRAAKLEEVAVQRAQCALHGAILRAIREVRE